MARLESRYVCQGCGSSTLRWEGQCRSCGEWNTLVESLVRAESPTRRRTSDPATVLGSAAPVRLADIPSADAARRPTGLGEVDQVLGGGLVPGSLVLLGGEPGIGKSTLVLEIAGALAAHGPVLYASGEESGSQLRLRASRLGLTSGDAGDRIVVVAETSTDAIVAAAGALDPAPALVIVDSIQTMTADGLEGPAGSVGQVREATVRLQSFAKERGVPVVLVGHVTKEGTLAGPRTLEHLVDVVLTLEGERFGALRLLRAAKNRFGSTEEVGVLEMTEAGLRAVPDPGRAFLGEAANGAAGVAVGATLEGTRPLLIEVQTLVSRVAFGMPRRTVAGLDGNRLALLVAVLGRHAGVPLGDHDVYASLAGGASVGEPALDLPLALALASSLRDRPVRAGLAACGEVSLLGGLRPVRGLDRRLREAARLGFTEAVVPADDRGGPAPRPGTWPAGLRVTRVGSLREAIAVALAPGDGDAGRPEAAPRGKPADGP